MLPAWSGANSTTAIHPDIRGFVGMVLRPGLSCDSQAGGGFVHFECRQLPGSSGQIRPLLRRQMLAFAAERPGGNVWDPRKRDPPDCVLAAVASRRSRRGSRCGVLTVRAGTIECSALCPARARQL